MPERSPLGHSTQPLQHRSSGRQRTASTACTTLGRYTHAVPASPRLDNGPALARLTPRAFRLPRRADMSRIGGRIEWSDCRYDIVNMMTYHVRIATAPPPTRWGPIAARGIHLCGHGSVGSRRRRNTRHPWCVEAAERPVTTRTLRRWRGRPCRPLDPSTRLDDPGQLEPRAL